MLSKDERDTNDKNKVTVYRNGQKIPELDLNPFTPAQNDNLVKKTEALKPFGSDDNAARHSLPHQQVLHTPDPENKPFDNLGFDNEQGFSILHNKHSRDDGNPKDTEDGFNPHDHPYKEALNHQPTETDSDNP